MKGILSLPLILGFLWACDGPDQDRGDRAVEYTIPAKEYQYSFWLVPEIP
jgi:hypothetical protein